MESTIEVPTPMLRCRRRVWGRRAWLQLSGELDLASSPWLSDAMRELLADYEIAVLDLQQLEFMDCSGVHAIEDAGIAALIAGRRLVIARAPEPVMRIFRLTGADLALEFLDLADAA